MKILLLTMTVFAAGCGYHAAGRADLVPKNIHTIAVSPWANGSTQFKLANSLTSAVTREFLARTRYSIVADPSKADAVLSGTVANVYSGATVATEGRSTAAQVTVLLQVRLVDKTGKELFSRPNLMFRQRYEISVDPLQYFDESQAAMERLAHDVAKSVVSAVLENF